MITHTRTHTRTHTPRLSTDGLNKQITLMRLVTLFALTSIKTSRFLMAKSWRFGAKIAKWIRLQMYTQIPGAWGYSHYCLLDRLTCGHEFSPHPLRHTPKIPRLYIATNDADRNLQPIKLREISIMIRSWDYSLMFVANVTLVTVSSPLVTLVLSVI